MSRVARRLEVDVLMRDERALVDACHSVVDATGIVAGLRAAESLQLLACRSSGTFDTVDVLAELLDQRDDQLAAIAGVHALSGVPGSLATAVLDEALDDERWFVTEHAAWSFSARSPHRPAMDRLASMVADGGFRGMVAQRTLAGWAHGDGNGVLAALHKALERAAGAGRVALVDAVSAVPGAAATALLERLAVGGDADAQRAAIAALGWRSSDPDLLTRLALDDTEIGEIALLALIDKTLSTRTTEVTPSQTPGGHRIAQVVIHAEFDERLVRAGAGDNGGLATLVSQLSTAFTDRGDVAQITTITRGSTGDAITDAFFGSDDKERLASVPFGGRGPIDRRSSWAHRLAVERGIRRVFLAGARPDVVHLRMADVGTLAAGRVARQFGIPVVFTAAPDPHVVLGQLDPAKVTRRNFGDHDELEHYWFRARMVERMTNQAAQVVLLPRNGDNSELIGLFGAHAAERLDRAMTISEGVDPAPMCRARRAVSALYERPDRPDELESLRRSLELLPSARHGLPLVISVGRLHPSKGMDRVARAWVGDETLRATTNLAIIGGDLERPTADELDVLAQLDEILGDADERRRTGVVLLGHQPNEVVAHALAAAAIGLPGLVAPGGIYVGGAAKEEFGLAIVEALGAGLTVVAPDVGGPATYVVDGDTGVLADTRSVSGLRTAIVRARRLVGRPGRVERAQDLVLNRLTIDAMAASLLDAYKLARADVT